MVSVATMRDVASEAGVSTATISRYLNGKTNHMSSATAKRVTEAIKKLNYVPNESARQLITKQSRLVAVVAADVDDYFSTEIFKGVNSVLKKNNFIAVLMDSDSDEQRELGTLSSLNQQMFGGVIIQPLSNDLKAFKKVIPQNIPVVMLDRQVENSPWPSVVTNNYTISKKAAQYFKDQGLNHVFVITNNVKNVSTREERLSGIKAVFHENVQIIEPGNSEDSFNEAYAKLKRSVAATHGGLIFALKERWLLKFLPKLIRDGVIRKSDGVHMTGFSDTSLTDNIDPGIKVINQDPYQIGVSAAQILIEGVDSATQPIAKKIEIPAQF